MSRDSIARSKYGERTPTSSLLLPYILLVRWKKPLNTLDLWFRRPGLCGKVRTTYDSARMLCKVWLTNRGVDCTDLLALDVGRLGECEFFLISEMNSHLIVHQPYRTLTSLQSDLYLSQDEINTATSVINDHYMTDLPLLYPPHIIALTAILLSLVLRPNSVGGGTAANMAAATAALTQVQGRAGAISGSATTSGQTTPGGADTKDKQQEARVGKVQRFAAFLAESNVDIEGMVDCTQELISFYECYEQYNDKMTREQINRIVKARGLDKAS